MASTVSLSAATNINVVASVSTDITSPYYTKKNLNEKPGSFLTQATILVYDDILRFQKSTSNPTADITNFVYDQFAGNVLWFMDELVGMESDWRKTASPGITGNTAYGYVQFTEDTVKTAVNRYIDHLERFNERKDTRDWQPYGIPKGVEILTPSWLIQLNTALDNGTYNHKVNFGNLLSYDEILALAFVHLHRKESKDSNFVLLARGDITAAKDLYKNNHHTNPDTDTLTRLNITGGGYFQIHYKKAPTITQRVMELTPAVTAAKVILAEIKTSRYQKIIDTVKGWFGW